jgi:hypothetical protein
MSLLSEASQPIRSSSRSSSRVRVSTKPPTSARNTYLELADLEAKAAQLTSTCGLPARFACLLEVT